MMFKQWRYTGNRTEIQRIIMVCIIYIYNIYIYTRWWFGAFFIFPHIWNVIIPTDELIFFRGVGIPPTSIV